MRNIVFIRKIFPYYPCGFSDIIVVMFLYHPYGFFLARGFHSFTHDVFILLAASIWQGGVTSH